MLDILHLGRQERREAEVSSVSTIKTSIHMFSVMFVHRVEATLSVSFASILINVCTGGTSRCCRMISTCW